MLVVLVAGTVLKGVCNVFFPAKSPRRLVLEQDEECE